MAGKIVRVEIADGFVLEGEEHSLAQMLRKFNIVPLKPIHDNKIYHFSDTKGEWIKIEDMDDAYIANCLSKMLRTQFRYGVNDSVSIMKLLADDHFFALLKEYKKRQSV